MAAAAAPLPETVSADSLPTVQIDSGVVWSQVIVGNTVYVAGQFSNARPAGAAPGTSLSARGNILAYNLTTGALIASFAPSFNNRINELAASPDGTKLYVTGSFTQVNGQSRLRFAVLDIPSGNLVAGTAALNNIGKAVYATSSGVFVGGYFTSVSSNPRQRVVKLNLAGTALLPFAVPVDNGQVQSIVANGPGDRVALSGNFTSVGGADTPGFGLYLADATSGSGLPLPANTQVRNGGDAAGFMSLATDGTNFYGSGWHYGGTGNVEGSFAVSWTSGSIVWIEDCHGDTYDIAVVNGIAYSASHKHYCGNSGGFPQTDPWSFYHSTAWTADVRGTNTGDIYGYPDHPGTPRPELLNWFPQTTPGTFTGTSQAVWTVTGNSQYVIYGGEFPSVNGTRQQGLVRYAVRSIAPNLQGPRDSGDAWNFSAKSFAAGQVRVRYQTNWDRDDTTLTYRVYRDSEASAPISQKTISTVFWKPLTETVTDTGLAPGSSHRYRVVASDPYGNVAKSSWVTLTVSNAVLSDYASDVLNDDAEHFWRLSDSDLATAGDWAGISDLTINGTVASTAGAILPDADTAKSFSGGAFGSMTDAIAGPNTFTVEAWVKTNTTSGGKIVGFGGSSTGNSGSYDRHVYMDNAGRIWFGVYPGDVRTVNSSAGYNDNQWHHIVASLSSGGMKLYLDGKRVAQRTDVTSAQGYSGYWRVGGDNLGGWPNQPSTNYLNGAIDDVAVYGDVLTVAEVQKHFRDSGRTLDVPVAPADAYGALVYNAQPDLYWRYGETSGSAVADSSISGNAGAIAGSFTRNVTGAIAGTTNRAIALSGSSNVYSTAQFGTPGTFTLETWFQTTSTQGGKVIGFGDAQSGTSSNYDRHVYMQDNGQLVFGTWTGQTNTITSPNAYNNGQWHYLVASQGPDGMSMYVDGVLVGTHPQTAAQPYSGYWRVGGDTTWGSSSPFLTGRYDETAVYSRVLTSTEVTQHYGAGTTGSTPNIPPTAQFTYSLDHLDASFQSAGSSDPDGTIASYSWQFGDGGTSTAPNPTHHYTAGGDYTVSLTVTDDDGATNTSQVPITVVANAAPVAQANWSAVNLAATFSASGSTDSDGSITSFAWDFGDGDTGSGQLASHTYDAAGPYSVILTVTDDDGATASTTLDVVVSEPANSPPVAAFTPTVTGMSVAVDASASTDSDGTIASYAWAFGDGGTATGKTATHLYTEPGAHTITLTVTDDDGSTDTETASVTVEEPSTSTPLFRDEFSRTAASGWGTADIGGAWGLRTTATRYSVSNGSGNLIIPKAATIYADATSVSTDRVRVDATFSVDKLAEGTYVAVIGRQVGADYYVLRIRIGADGSARMYVLRNNSVAIGSSLLLPFTVQTGQKYNVAFEVAGTSPTALKAKVWAASATEPTTWQREATDATAVLQAAGRIGVFGFLPAAATNDPVTVSFDRIVAMDPDGVAPPAGNEDPTAAFTPTVTGLKVDVNGSASTDSDGSIASYAWQFGDPAGSTATGATASHTYTAAGTYTVRLTVTDDDGATDTITHDVTVAATPTNASPTAAFTATPTGLTVAVDAADSDDSDGTIASYAWQFGDPAAGTATGETASYSYAAGGTYTITLTVTDDDGATATATHSVTVAPPATGALFADTFARTASGAWGTSDSGGAWTVRGAASRFAVAGGVGTLSVGAGTSLFADTPVIDSTSTTLRGTFTVDKVNEGMYIGLIARRVGTTQYLVRVRVAADGTVKLNLIRGDSTSVGAAVSNPGFTVVAGQTYRFRIDTKTTTTTTISARFWNTSDTEPTGWQLERSDATAGLQVAGSAGVYGYLPSATANVPAALSFDNLEIVTAP
ncbi:PDK repeat-containing protein [Microbacterium terricola]|uniref:PDK repeat-containing protein n=1 Tax=Microbacterium terricola TaxID=344163 RepID=A0ABM8DV13_9MICO|nr:PDK repeat-containing protein [Microbacterium terricola]